MILHIFRIVASNLQHTHTSIAFCSGLRTAFVWPSFKLAVNKVFLKYVFMCERVHSV